MQAVRKIDQIQNHITRMIYAQALLENDSLGIPEIPLTHDHFPYVQYYSTLYNILKQNETCPPPTP